MSFIQEQSPQQQEKSLRRIVRAFREFAKQEFNCDLYDYQVRIAEACLRSLFLTKEDVAIAISRQSGKTESVTLLVRFLLIFHKLLTGVPLMCGIASPKGEQAKTDVDRVKKSVALLRQRWQVEDREFNAATVRAYRNDELFGEIFKFSLAPTTSNESKTLNLLIVEEAHLSDDTKRSNELDPMLTSVSGVTFFIGVGCTRVCDFFRAKNGQMMGCVPVVVSVDDVIRDRRKKYEETGDPKHLEYEKAFQRELRKKGAHNPELRRNYYLEDQVEVGGFVSRERLLGCARGSGVEVPTDRLYVGIDWARSQDSTWITIVNDRNDVIEWFKYPHVPYLEQVQMMQADLSRKRTAKRVVDGKEDEYEWAYQERIAGVRGDATGGSGDAPNEMLREHSGLPVGDESLFKFTLQSKNDLYLHFESALFKDADDEYRFTYPADHPLAGEFEEQMTRLMREYKGDGEYLSVHHPEEQGARDDAPDATALALYAAKESFVGELLIA